MSQLENIRITTGSPSPEHAHHYLKSDQGRLAARQSIIDGSYEIQDYLVVGKWRRQGYGKELLQLALQHAKALGATAITASNIVSRESIDALESVFGPECLMIEERGDYAPDGKDSNAQNPTKASMVYEISENSLSDNRYAQVVEESLREIDSLIRTYSDVVVSLSRKIHTYHEKTESKLWRLSDEDASEYELARELRQLIVELRKQHETKMDTLEEGV